VLTQDSVSAEALFILRNLRENAQHGRSNKLSDVKVALEKSVSLEFDRYFFFLRKFHYIAMDREAQLRVTDHGEALLTEGESERFRKEVSQFFSDQLATSSGNELVPPDAEEEDDLDEKTQTGMLADDVVPPPLPSEASAPKQSHSADDDDEGSQMASSPPPRSRKQPPPPPETDELTNPTPVPGGPPGRPEHTEVTRTPPPAPPGPSMVGFTASLGGTGPRGTDLDLRYVKFDPVGAGPLGTVFKGKHNALGTEVAIKELKDIFGYFSFLQRGEVIKRLKKELCAQAGVRHAGIVTVLDQNTDVARPYYVLEMMKGSLREKLDAAGGKALPVDLSIRYFLQVAYALRAAHAQGLTHHNLKPENVLFDVYGNVKLSDFGLSRVIEVDASKGMPQVFVGTGGMAYMAPEQLARQKDLGTTADVYALGILLYELLTGQIPGRRSPMPSDVNENSPEALDAIFDKMTHDRRESRYPDLDAVLNEFYAGFKSTELGKKGDLILWSEVKGEG
jgi:hypothetical protein